MFLVRVESSTDPTGSLPWFGIVDPAELGKAIVDADWQPGMWMTPYEDGYAIAGFAGRLPRAGHELWVRIFWYPLRAVPGFPALSQAGTLRGHDDRPARR